MSLRILKAGILDTVQDAGRFGFQYLGVNATGVMDKYAAAVANALVGNKINDAVIEIHFPGPVILFEEPAVIALSGADFDASVNEKRVPVNHPVMLNKNTILRFRSSLGKSRCYLALHGGLKLDKWLNSYSTNLKAEAGGLAGKKLAKDDALALKSELHFRKIIGESDFTILPWKVHDELNGILSDGLLVLPGSEWDWMDGVSQEKFLNRSFAITNNSDRMGYRLDGEALRTKNKEELVSSPVTFGTIQLLPDGQLIILAADHQTTGGYPRIGNVISACHTRLAQLKAGEHIRFSLTDHQTAEELLVKQQRFLLNLEIAGKLRLEQFIHENN